MSTDTALFSFPRDSDLTHMLYWLGEDYPAALAGWVERGFNRQQPGTRLAALRCRQRPDLRTAVRASGRVTEMAALFELQAFLSGPAGAAWRLDLEVTLTGHSLDDPQAGRVSSDVQVRASQQLMPSGLHILEDLAVGVWLEGRLLRLEWDALLEEFLLLADPQVEIEGETYYLSWSDESIFEGLRGDLLASFPPDQPVLRYLTLRPLEHAFDGDVDDGLCHEWEHLTTLFGLPTARLPGGGFRWSLASIEILLLYSSLNEFHHAQSFTKFLAIHWLG